jgi:hypothetical protein
MAAAISCVCDPFVARALQLLPVAAHGIVLCVSKRRHAHLLVRNLRQGMFFVGGWVVVEHTYAGLTCSTCWLSLVSSLCDLQHVLAVVGFVVV